MGDPLPEEIVRAAMLLRIKDFTLGHTGICLETVQHLVTLLNSGVCPVVPSQGSVGASGDLAPLAHLALVLIGKGEAWYRGRRMTGKAALKKCGLPPWFYRRGKVLRS